MASACSTKAADTTAKVTGTDDGCEITPDVLDAGSIDFEFTNRAAKVNELYVVNAAGDVMGEIENITTGTSRTLTADLTKGDYKVRCKPGQTGDGIESSFTVTGDGGTAQAAPDRTIAFKAVDFTYEELDLTGISAGTTVRFEMANAGTQAHEFEVLDPSGEAVGEVASMEPGASGGATITLVQPGQYTYQCILEDPATGKEHTELGMIGNFEVASAQ
jgi:uncharacterized cupredoxin-like copper-binding protein